MAEEAGRFDFAAVARAIADKMVRRHPHVFGDAAPRDAAAQTDAWEAQKAAERAAEEPEGGALAGVPTALPALSRAAKLTRRAARVGFDWPDAAAVLDKLEEEAAELRAELPDGRPGAAARTRWATCSSSWPTSRGSWTSIRRTACARPTRSSSAASGPSNGVSRREGLAPGDAGLDAMEEEWRAAKAAER